MKASYTQAILLLAFCLLSSIDSLSQILIGPPTDSPHLTAALEIRSDSGGLLIPNIELKLINNEVVAPLISLPADGLLIFHDGTLSSGESSGLPRGLWYYDEVAAGSGKWLIYSRTGSIYSSSLDNFGEMYEAKEMGAGSSLTIYDTYSVPWSSASPGYLGPGFELLQNVNVTTEIGSTVIADQLYITTTSAYYTVDASATLVTGTSANIVTGQLFVNDVPIPGVFFRHAFQVSGEYVNCSTNGIVVINQYDKVDFRFKTNSAVESILIEHLNLKLTKIGDYN